MKMLMFLLVILISIGTVSAVGIVWSTEGDYVTENSEKCITYGAYNPSAQDIKVKIEATESLKEAIIGESVSNKIIKAGTEAQAAEKVDFCFKVPQVYKQDCLMGNILCKKTCGEETKVYKGEVTMSEEVIGGDGGSGSGVSAEAAAPLELRVLCVPYERNWSPVYIVGIIIVLILIGMLLYKEYSTPQVVRDEERLKRLQDKIKTEKGKK